MVERARYFNNAITVDGLSIRIVPFAEVTVYYKESTDLFTDPIYEANTGSTTRPNPFFADQYGNVLFYITTAQRVKLVLTGSGMGTLTLDNEPVWPAPEDLTFGSSGTFLEIGAGISISRNIVGEYAATVQSIAEDGLGLLVLGSDDLARLDITDEYGSMGDVLYVDYVNERVGINNTAPLTDLDISGGMRLMIPSSAKSFILQQLATGDSVLMAARTTDGLTDIFKLELDDDKQRVMMTFDNLSTLKFGYNGATTLAMLLEDSAGADLLSLNSTTGLLETKNIQPFTTNTQFLGGPSKSWLVTYTRFGLFGMDVSGGTVGGPVITSLITGDGTLTGLYWPAVGQLGVTINNGAGAGIACAIFSSLGLVLEASSVLKNLTNPTTPASGYTSISPDASNNLWIMNSSTAKRRILDTSYVAPGVRVYQSANLAIPNAGLTAVTFDTEDYDTDTMHSTVSVTERLVATTAGRYNIQAYAAWAGSTAGTLRIAEIVKNGVTQIQQDTRIPLTTGGVTLQHIFAVTVNLAAGDYISLRMYQDTGGSLNSVGTALGTAMNMTRVSA